MAANWFPFPNHFKKTAIVFFQPPTVSITLSDHHHSFYQVLGSIQPWYHPDRKNRELERLASRLFSGLIQGLMAYAVLARSG